MSAIEESLRRALDNGDAADPDFRRTIYAASERALERMLATREVDEAGSAEQRQRLGETIDRLEGEYAARFAPGSSANGSYRADETASFKDDAAPAATAAIPPSDRSMNGSHGAPLRRSAVTEDASAVRAPGSFAPPPSAREDDADTAQTWRPGGDRGETSAPRRRRFRLLLVLLAVLIFLAIMGYVASVVLAPTGTTTTTGTGGEPGASAASEGGQPPELAWIDVFSGDNLQALSAPSGGRIEAVEQQGNQAVRIAGPEGAPAEILLSIGPGLVGEIAGSSVRVEVRAGSPDGSLREFAVSCLFGSASICDRQRFATSMNEEAFVFDIEIPEDVETPASLAIDPGLGEGGRDIDLYAVRVRVL